MKGNEGTFEQEKKSHSAQSLQGDDKKGLFYTWTYHPLKG